MNQRDNEFFEEYKNLDKLCGEILNCEKGVSTYITIMEESTPCKTAGTIWNGDYKLLKHLRYVRNQIAHDTGDSAVSTDEDLYNVKRFVNRILKQDDPLSYVDSAASLKKKAQDVVTAPKQHEEEPVDEASEKKNFTRFIIYTVAIVVLVVLAILIGAKVF